MKQQLGQYKKPDSIKALEVLSVTYKRKLYPNAPYPVNTRYRDDKTNELTRSVIDWIIYNEYQAERINSTGRQILSKGNSKWIKANTTNGTADISATIKGRSVKIEIKCRATRDNCQSEDQVKYQKQIEKAGGVYLIVRNFTQFYNWYHEFLNVSI